MIDPEEQNRWESLAEELGLPPESASSPARAETAPYKAEARAAARREVEALPDEGGEDLPEARLEEDEEARSPRGRRRRGRQAEILPESEAGGDEPVEAAEPAPEGEDAPGTETIRSEDEPPRGRRRRRRGGRKSKSTEPEGAASEADEPVEGATEAASAEVGEEERPRRRRRRGKKTTLASEETASGTEDEDDSEQDQDKPRPALEEEEETEDFSTWNIPSWSEIIASLYRPER